MHVNTTCKPPDGVSTVDAQFTVGPQSRSRPTAPGLSLLLFGQLLHPQRFLHDRQARVPFSLLSLQLEQLFPRRPQRTGVNTGGGAMVIIDKYGPVAIYFIFLGLSLYTLFVFPV